VVILVVHENCIFNLESECHAPVPADLDRPVIRKHPLERMQIPAWNIHSTGVLGRIQQRKLPAQPGGVGWLDTTALFDHLA
jgi:hypothetical protein